MTAVADSLSAQLQAFLLPHYQHLDGASRLDDVERIARIARQLYQPASVTDARDFHLLLHFHILGKWLERVGNISRTTLAIAGVTEEELRRTAASIRNLANPQSHAERAVAAAVLIDRAGLRGLVEQFGRARREGNSLMDVVRAAVTDLEVPEWLPPRAEAWLHERRERRREACRLLLEELALDDLK